MNCCFQVEARAYEIWGGEEGLKEAHLKKAEMREKKLEKKYAKDIKGVCVQFLCKSRLLVVAVNLFLGARYQEDSHGVHN